MNVLFLIINHIYELFETDVKPFESNSKNKLIN